MTKIFLFLCPLFLLIMNTNAAFSQDRERVRQLDIKPGILEPGELNAITDVKGVKVGHKP